MEGTAKYLVHADIVADGVVERSDVVGAIFGQTEGLLGDELDLRDLQRASKLGRINVEIDSENGQSFGRVTIASSLDRVETAILAAALETIDRVGPCRSNVAVARIEDVRAAKRRKVVERAKALLGQFDESVTSTQELVEEVRKSVRIEDITEYEGLPAGPRVGAGDAVIVVEGRADVLTLLRYGIKNAVAVEGTNVPEAVAALTADRTATAFLDGDRGGDLILKELAQVGDVDYVAISPSDRSVEDLTRREALAALREKVPYAEVAAADDPRAAVAGPETNPSAATAEAETDGSGADVDSIDTGAIDAAGPNTSEPAADVPTPAEIEGVEAGTSSSRTDAATSAEASETAEPAASSEPTETGGSGEPSGTADSAPSAGTTSDETDEADVVSEANAADEADRSGNSDDPGTLHGHVWAVAGTGTVRVLDAAFATLVDAPIEGAFDAIESAKDDPMAVVMDGEVTQRILDVAAQRGVEQVVAREEGSFVKQPTSVRVRTASELRSE